MIRSRHVPLVVALAIMGGAGCTGTPVGRLCDIGQTPGSTDVVVASPSLDCVSRTCLRVPVTNPNPPKGTMAPTGSSGLCTAQCQSSGDCAKVPESPCVSGFTCAVAVTVGPFCCKKFCICKDYVVVPSTGQIATPAACDPTNTANACCNLPGRPGSTMYPLCKT